MEIKFTAQADKDLLYWRKSNHGSIQKKITELLRAIKSNPYKGIGKPEALKYDLIGKWSRRISQKDRIVYEVDLNKRIIIIHSLKGHYY